MPIPTVLEQYQESVSAIASGLLTLQDESTFDDARRKQRIASMNQIYSAQQGGGRTQEQTHCLLKVHPEVFLSAIKRCWEERQWPLLGQITLAIQNAFAYEPELSEEVTMALANYISCCEEIQSFLPQAIGAKKLLLKCAGYVQAMDKYSSSSTSCIQWLCESSPVDDAALQAAWDLLLPASVLPEKPKGSLIANKAYAQIAIAKLMSKKGLPIKDLDQSLESLSSLACQGFRQRDRLPSMYLALDKLYARLLEDGTPFVQSPKLICDLFMIAPAEDGMDHILFRNEIEARLNSLRAPEVVQALTDSDFGTVSSVVFKKIGEMLRLDPDKADELEQQRKAFIAKCVPVLDSEKDVKTVRKVLEAFKAMGPVVLADFVTGFTSATVKHGWSEAAELLNECDAAQAAPFLSEIVEALIAGVDSERCLVDSIVGWLKREHYVEVARQLHAKEGAKTQHASCVIRNTSSIVAKTMGSLKCKQTNQTIALLLEEVAKKPLDPRDGLTFSLSRLCGDLLTQGQYQPYHPLTEACLLALLPIYDKEPYNPYSSSALSGFLQAHRGDEGSDRIVLQLWKAQKEPGTQVYQALLDTTKETLWYGPFVGAQEGLDVVRKALSCGDAKLEEAAANTFAKLFRASAHKYRRSQGSEDSPDEAKLHVDKMQLERLVLKELFEEWQNLSLLGQGCPAAEDALWEIADSSTERIPKAYMARFVKFIFCCNSRDLGARLALLRKLCGSDLEFSRFLNRTERRGWLSISDRVKGLSERNPACDQTAGALTDGIMDLIAV